MKRVFLATALVVLLGFGRMVGADKVICTADAVPGAKDIGNCPKQCKGTITVHVEGSVGAIGRATCGSATVSCRVIDKVKPECEKSVSAKADKANGTCIALATKDEPATATCTMDDP